VVDTKLTVRNMVEQIDNLLREPADQSSFTAPVRNFPDTVPAGERARLRQAHLPPSPGDRPAYRRLRDFLQNEYLPRARDRAGLVHMRGGDRLYRADRGKHTLPLEAERSTSSAARSRRIRGEMERSGPVGFRVAQFFEHLRTDRASPRQPRGSATAISDRPARRARIGEFSPAPRDAPGIREVEAFRERTEAAVL
jgi:uncharacterized protein (DUF885 family)